MIRIGVAAQYLFSGLTALALLVGCADDRIVETQVVVLAESAACEGARDVRARVNGYRVVVFDFESSGVESEDSPCVACVREGRCPVREEQCLCGPPRAPSTVAINNQLAGLRFENLPPGQPYCVGLIGYDLPTLPVMRETTECGCDFEVEDPDPFNRLCGLSAFPGEVGENSAAIFVPVDCRPGCPAIFGR